MSSIGLESWQCQDRVVATDAVPLLRRIEREFVERGLSGRGFLCVTFDPVQGLVEAMYLTIFALLRVVGETFRCCFASVLKHLKCNYGLMFLRFSECIS